jgi:Transposase DDE domain
MYIDIVPNRTSPPAILLRESIREGKKVHKRTLANLSSLSLEQAEAIRRILKGQVLVPVEEVFEVEASHHHGHVRAVWEAMSRLGVAPLLGSRASRQRELVMAMMMARVLKPQSKLATTRWWKATTLPAVLGLGAVVEEELYAALDWLLARQGRIEAKLAERHLRSGGVVLYDLTSSYLEGKTCPLGARGYNRDGKRGKLQINYGLLTDRRGCPVAVSVFEGNTSDPQTLLPQVEKMRTRFGIRELVLVGDRGMLCQSQIDVLKHQAGVDWISALKSGAIRRLLQANVIPLERLAEQPVFVLTHPDYPGERLMVCRNVELGRLRAQQRQALLEATEQELTAIQGMIARGTLVGVEQIGLRVGKVINRYKMAKHFQLDLQADRLCFQRDVDKIAAESALDGLYVVRTSLCEACLGPEDTVRSYKNLSRVEQAFRSLKSLDLEVRPIYHRLADRVKAHILLCTLAYYVKWHMMEAWRPLLFADEPSQANSRPDPVAPAQRSDAARQKIQSKTLADGTEVHSFHTLLHSLSTLVRNTCRRKATPTREPAFTLDTQPNAEQQRAYDLLKTIKM